MENEQTNARTDAPGGETTDMPATPERADTDGGNRREAFDKLIRGEYKGEFEARVQQIINRRFRETREWKEKADKLSPMYDLLSERYGETDAEKLLTRLQSETEHPNAPDPEASEDEKRAAAVYDGWMRDAEAAKQAYPEFDFKDEMRSGNFGALLRAGVDVKTAYEVTHRDELMAGAVRYAAMRAREKTIADIRARGARPDENGALSRAASYMRPARVEEMTRRDREQIEKRALRGEKIQFA